jgi:hypothetical protein
MAFDSPDELMILSTRRVLGAEIIDGGDTIVLRVCRADGKPAAIFVPRTAAQAMAQILSEKLDEAASSAATRLGR